MRELCMRMGRYLVIVLFVAGCQMGDDVSRAWIGHHRNELVQTWGAPSQETPLLDGGKLVQYSHEWNSGYGAHTCVRKFLTDAQGIIRSFESSGC